MACATVGLPVSVVTVVWVGNDQNQPTGLTGATGAMPIWARMMAQLHPLPVPQTEPPGIHYLATHHSLGAQVSRHCDNAVELPFIQGSEPQVEVGCSGNYTAPSKGKKWWQRLVR